MKIYADRPDLRARQVVRDAAAALWVLAWAWLGLALYSALDDLRGAGDTTDAAASDLAGRLDGIGGVIGGLPLLGSELRRPFAGAADASRSIAAAGASASDSVHTMALWLGLLVALVPIAWLAARYLPRRVRWVREATAVRTLRMDEPAVVDLLAARAMATHPMDRLAPLAGDPAGLARLELRRLGVVA
ncbi:MAG TPA: hypothetical protein VFV35_08015 [Acidimicrobiales bacterium]|nr:hypothetical protein [Acidimicrobiales bacterium]